jgi:hypothetical protein
VLLQSKLSGRLAEAARDGRLALDLLPVSKDGVEAENVLLPVGTLYSLRDDPRYAALLEKLETAEGSGSGTR